MSLASWLCPSKDKEAGSVPAVQSKAPAAQTVPLPVLPVWLAQLLFTPVPIAS